MNQSRHGGSRPAVRPDDGRLSRKMEKPKAVTVWIEAAQLDRLRNSYGRDWQDVLRQLIAEHLHAATSGSPGDAAGRE